VEPLENKSFFGKTEARTSNTGLCESGSLFSSAVLQLFSITSNLSQFKEESFKLCLAIFKAF